MNDLMNDNVTPLEGSLREGRPGAVNLRYGYVVPNGPVDHAAFA